MRPPRGENSKIKEVDFPGWHKGSSFGNLSKTKKKRKKKCSPRRQNILLYRKDVLCALLLPSFGMDLK